MLKRLLSKIRRGSINQDSVLCDANTFLAGINHDANLVWNNSRRLLDCTIDVMLYKGRVGFGYVM